MSLEFVTSAVTKWQLDEFMSIVDEFEDEFADTVGHKLTIANDYHTVLVHIAGKVLLTTRELLNLCALGYPDGALSLARNLYEQMVIVSFFEAHKKDADFQKYIDDFFLSYRIQRNKMLRVCENFFPEEKAEDLLQEYAEVKKQAHQAVNGDYWWTGYSSFAKLAESIINDASNDHLRRFLGKQYITYKRACLSLHAGCMGNAIRIGSDVNYGKIDTSPTEYGQSTPLGYAAASLIMIIGTLCIEFNINHEKYLKKLNSLAITYQGKEKGDIRPSE